MLKLIILLTWTCISICTAANLSRQNGSEYTCITAPDSTNPGVQCKFPFTHKGVIYNGCPTHPKDKNQRWCSIKIDEFGNHVPDESDNYEICDKLCPVHVSKGICCKNTVKPCKWLILAKTPSFANLPYLRLNVD